MGQQGTNQQTETMHEALDLQNVSKTRMLSDKLPGLDHIGSIVCDKSSKVLGVPF